MIILVGASASGKTEVAKLLGEKYHITKVITHTTRKMRVNEKQDIDYHFVDKDTFLELKNKNSFVETTIYNDNYYGTSYAEIDDVKVLIVDPNGLKSFLDLNNHRIVTFYLISSEKIRMQHMINRGDSRNDVLNRIANDRKNFNDEIGNLCDFVIDSDSHTISEMADIIYRDYQNILKNL